MTTFNRNMKSAGEARAGAWCNSEQGRSEIARIQAKKTDTLKLDTSMATEPVITNVTKTLEQRPNTSAGPEKTM